MCGRFASSLPPEAIRALFRTTGVPPNLGPSWNVAPSQDAMVVRRHPETGERRLDALQWGLAPPFTTDVRTAPKPINARSETAATSGMFRPALAKRRAIVPADAYFEWRATQTGKQPYAIARADGAPVVFAGLWESWRAQEGETVRTFAILTTNSNRPMAALHPRMPVVLEEADWPVWLGEVDGDAMALLRPAAEDVLRLWPVSRAVNNVRNNGRELLERTNNPAAPSPSNVVAGQKSGLGFRLRR